jgi:hypothetical protein
MVQLPPASPERLCQEGWLLNGDPPERRLRAVAPRRAEDRRREELTDLYRHTWQHGVNGQAQVIKAMQELLTPPPCSRTRRR